MAECERRVSSHGDSQKLLGEHVDSQLRDACGEQSHRESIS